MKKPAIDWSATLVILFFLPFAHKTLAELNTIAVEQEAQNVMPKAFWLWFDNYADSDGLVFDPLDSDTLVPELKELNTATTQGNASKLELLEISESEKPVANQMLQDETD